MMSTLPSLEPPSMTKYSSPGRRFSTTDLIVSSRYPAMLKDGVTTEMRIRSLMVRNSRPAAPDRCKLVEKFHRTRNIIGRRKAPGPDAAGGDQVVAQRLVGKHPHDRIGDAGRISGVTEHG